jgi:galactan endo-1,6-beta-galactosidase
MATVAQRAADHWGITFTTVEPFNEPLSTWWKSTGTQEGCHFSTGLQATIIDLLRQELDARGLTSMAIAASDCNRYDEAVSNWNAFNALTRAKVGQINVHGYQYSSGNRAGVYAAARAAEKPLYNSEYGESDVSGLKLAASVHRDFWTLHPTVWAHWQTMGSAWGTFTDTQTNPKHYVIAQYSRHIRPGMLILESSSESTVIAYDATAQKLVLVVANVGAAQDYRFDLGRFGSADGPVVRWLTVTGSGGERYVRHDDVAITNQQFSMSLPSGSVETFEIQNVRGPFLQVQPTLDKNTRKTE